MIATLPVRVLELKYIRGFVELFYRLYNIALFQVTLMKQLLFNIATSTRDKCVKKEVRMFLQ